MDDLLDVSRITRGKIELRKEPVDLAAVVARAVETSRPLIDARGHQLTVALPAEPVRVEADPTRLAQVVANLLNNAAKYTERGRPHLADRGAGGERGGGAGARHRHRHPGRVLPQVFDLFTQADRSLDRSRGRPGHRPDAGQAAWSRCTAARSRPAATGPGQGSEFVVRLPVAAATAGPGAAPAARRRPSGQAVRRRRVLVVDDNVDAAESLALLLRTEGPRGPHGPRRPGRAGGGARRSGPRSCCWTSACRAWTATRWPAGCASRAAAEATLLVALTGYGQEEDRRRVEEAGFDAHLVKPADPAALQTLLAGPSRQTESGTR